MRDKREKSIAQFFLPACSFRESELESSYVTVSSFFRSRCCGEGQNKIVLKDNLLLISTKGETEWRFTHGLHLLEGLTFKRLTGEDGDNEGGRQLKGFRLNNAEGHHIDLLLPFASLANIWVQQLARIINEVGFCQQFQTLRKLGKGSTACVYQVRRKSDMQLFAAKVILKGYLGQREERGKALAHEIQLLRALQHENVIKLEGVFESEQAFYLVFERLEGGTLLEYINSKRGLSLEETKAVMRGLTEGLAYLHRFGIAHRDLKLENVLLRGGDRLQPVIADFGLAVLVEEEPYLFYRCGTPGYVAPEVIRMRQNKTARVASDIFSAGVIFHVLLTNSYLFPGSNNQEVYRLNCEAKHDLSGDKYDKLDPDALEMLKKMLTVRAGDRITADDMLDEPFLQEEDEESVDQKGQDEKYVVSPAATEAGECLF